MELLKKITMRDIGVEKQLDEVVKNGGSAELANVAGVAKGVKTGVSGFGEWTALTGDFVAINAEGIEYRSAVLILPSIAQDLVINALKDADNGVELAFTITATQDQERTGKVRGKGYKFGAKPLIQPKEADELARLKSLFPGQKPALSAPASETKQIDAPAAPATPEVKVPAPASGATYEASPKSEVTPAKTPANVPASKPEPAKSSAVPAKK